MNRTFIVVSREISPPVATVWFVIEIIEHGLRIEEVIKRGIRTSLTIDIIYNNKANERETKTIVSLLSNLRT